MKTRLYLLALCLGTLLAISNASAAETSEINISGAGPSGKIVQIFFSTFKQHNPEYADIKFVVPGRSIKHAGGIRWSEKNLFGRTGRALKPGEKAKNKDELLLARIPAVFIKGEKVSIKRLSKDKLKSIYTGKIRNWKKLGGPDAEIQLIGREPAEAIYSKLRKLYPFMSDTKYWITFTRDHQVIGHMKSERSQYALAFGASPNFDKASVLSINGEQTGVSIGLVYDKKNQQNALLKAVKAFANSMVWKQAVIQSGYLSIN